MMVVQLWDNGGRFPVVVRVDELKYALESPPTYTYWDGRDWKTIPIPFSEVEGKVHFDETKGQRLRQHVYFYPVSVYLHRHIILRNPKDIYIVVYYQGSLKTAEIVSADELEELRKAEDDNEG